MTGDDSKKSSLQLSSGKEDSTAREKAKEIIQNAKRNVNNSGASMIEILIAQAITAARAQGIQECADTCKDHRDKLEKVSNYQEMKRADALWRHFRERAAAVRKEEV